MVFALLLLPIAAVLGYINHRARIRSLEREFSTRITDQMHAHSSRRSDDDREADESTGLDGAKSRLLVGMLHEVREPLMMLKTPLQSNLRVDGSVHLDDCDVRRMLDHANRLQRSIDDIQIVLESDPGSDALELTTFDFVDMMRHKVRSWSPVAERYGVTIRFRSDVPELPAAFDVSRIEQSLQHLVDRALIDMSDGGTLQVHLSRVEDTEEGQARIVLEMVDDGDLMNEDYIKVLESRENGGHAMDSVIDRIGLGLAIARRSVASHGGEISVEASGEKGTCLRVVLPLATGNPIATGNDHPADVGHPDAPGTRMREHPIVRSEASVPAHEPSSDSEENDASEKETTVLIVDDHPGTRGYLAYAIRKHHNVIEAANGADALKVIKRTKPDLVISDIMMPIMDGNELCRAIKQDESLNDIPIFLVTANAVPALKKEGLESGADDYLLKPFDLDEALMRINNEVKSRTELRRRFSRELVIKASDITVTSADEAFLSRARDLIEEHIEDGNFGVQELASEFAMSSRQLQRRLRETVDKSPVEFIRTLRLQRAAQLLEGHYGNVSEVAYSVGFTSLSYFAKCFREQFGSSPSEFKSRQAA